MKNIFLAFVLLFSSSIAFAQSQRIKVTKRTVITKPYTQKVQSGQQCYDDTIEVNVPCNNYEDSDTNSIGIDTVIGTVAGIAIGNQIGKGSGRDAAKVIGGILGGVAANQSRDYRGNGGGGTCKSYKTVQRCNPSYEYRTTHKTVGYNNCGYYEGEEVCVQTTSPIEYIRVEKKISIYAD